MSALQQLENLIGKEYFEPPCITFDCLEIDEKSPQADNNRIVELSINACAD